MFYILIITMCIITIIILKISLNIDLKTIKSLKTRSSEELEELSKKFPDDKKVCESILNQMQNNNVNIKEEKEYTSCLYTVFNNTITIGKFAQNYMKIQTIAHECIHACQNKITLWSNFIFTNIYLIYFVVISILNIFNKITNNEIQIIILVLMGLIQYIIRYSLESEAMFKAKYIAKEYIEKENLLSLEEKNKLLKEYEEINKIAIPFMNFYTLFMNISKVLLYAIISLI